MSESIHRSSTYHEVKDRLLLTRVEFATGTTSGGYHELCDALEILADYYEHE